MHVLHVSATQSRRALAFRSCHTPSRRHPSGLAFSVSWQPSMSLLTYLLSLSTIIIMIASAVAPDVIIVVT